MNKCTFFVIGISLMFLMGCGNPKTAGKPIQVDFKEYHETDCSLADAFRASGEEPLLLEDTMCSELTLRFPTVSCNDQAIADLINADLLKVYCAADEENTDCKSIDDVIRSFHEAASEMGIIVEIKSKIVVNDGEYLCIGHDVSSYGFGAAHPITGFGTSNYSAITGQILHLGDVFTEEGIKLLEEEGKKQHEALLAQEGIDQNGQDSPIEWEFKLPEDFSIDQNNINLYFDMYEAGPGVLGNVSIQIPREKLEGKFRD